MIDQRISVCGWTWLDCLLSTIPLAQKFVFDVPATSRMQQEQKTKRKEEKDLRAK
jgi:hypothetical protein